MVRDGPIVVGEVLDSVTPVPIIRAVPLFHFSSLRPGSMALSAGKGTKGICVQLS